LKEDEKMTCINEELR